MNSKEMLKTKLPKGCVFKNVAKYNKKPVWKIVNAPIGWWFKTGPGEFDWEQVKEIDKTINPVVVGME